MYREEYSRVMKIFCFLSKTSYDNHFQISTETVSSEKKNRSIIFLLPEKNKKKAFAI